MNLNRPIWPTSYSPSPEIPKAFRRGLARIGGKNIYGEPNYRVVWAMDARTFRNGNPRAATYPNPNDTSLGYACFWVERWASPEFFNKVHWGALRFGLDEAGTGKTIDYLGPFPARGGYIGVMPIFKEDEDGDPYEWAPLTTRLLEALEESLSPGSQKVSALGVVEAQERLKRAKTAAVVEKGLEEARAHYRTHAERINREASRKYVGLLSNLSPAAHQRTGALHP